MRSHTGGVVSSRCFVTHGSAMHRLLAGQTVLYRVHDAMRSTRGIQSALTQGMNPGACGLCKQSPERMHTSKNNKQRKTLERRCLRIFNVTFRSAAPLGGLRLATDIHTVVTSRPLCQCGKNRLIAHNDPPALGTHRRRCIYAVVFEYQHCCFLLIVASVGPSQSAGFSVASRFSVVR